jgi:PadR family transcriptional regulator, regulatory protein PadR
MGDESLELLQGTLDVLILRTLAWQSMHGYGVTQWIRERTDGALNVQDAALYQALRRLERKGWVESEWGMSENNRRARFYALTPAGRRQLQAEAKAWQRYAEAVFKVLEPVGDTG